jgi:hypothetical protein
METRYKNVYVTLNSLVDVRLTLAIYANPEIVTADDSFIHQYLSRKRDNIGGVPYTVIEDLYNANIDNLILQTSSATPLLHNVIVEDFITLQSSMYNDKKIELNNKLIINTYPYVLSEEAKEYFKILSNQVLPDVELELVRLNIAEVTVEWLVNNNVVSFYDYYGEDWLAYHCNLGDIIDNYGIKNISFIFPKINNGMIPLSDITDDFFTDAEDAVKDIINITHISPYFFSAFFKDYYLEDRINEIRNSDMKVNIAKEEEIIKKDEGRINERDVKQQPSRTTNVSKW